MTEGLQSAKRGEWPHHSCVRYNVSNGIATIFLDRPNKLNAFNADLISGLAKSIAQFDADTNAHVAVIAGNGRAFSAGADVSEESSLDSEQRSHLRDPMAPGTPFGDLLFKSDSWKPVIASVHGYALGMALGLVLQCDLIVADAGTQFQVTETSRGLGGYRHWALLSYRGVGALGDEVCLTGRFFSAEELHAAGALTRLTAVGESRKVALELAAEIAAQPPLSVRETVRIQRWHLRRRVDEVAFQTEAVRLHLTEDFSEATRAFQEKRAPGPFKGR